MIKTGFETRVKVQQIIENQLPEFLRSESPKSIDFLKQYYISQEYQSGPADLANNLDQYLKIDNLTPEVISGDITLSADINDEETTITVSSTKGFPAEYGLFQIDDEIFTYTSKTPSSFIGCVRGFSAVTSYKTDLNPEELIFSTSKAASHTAGADVKNLSAEFLKEFYKKLKYTYTPGLENVEFVSDLDVNNFIKEAKSLYESKGTEESFKILFNVLYGITPEIVDLEDYLIKPSSARYLRRENIAVEVISGDPSKLKGQTIRKSSDSETFASVSEVEIFSNVGVSTYYGLSLFVGYDDTDSNQGSFAVQPKVTAINSVSIGASVITVDSTIGFPNSGTLIFGSDKINYTSKTVNQFLDCTGVVTEIPIKGELRIDESFYGYEDGDINKRVDVRITGVLSNFKGTSDIKLLSTDQKIYFKNVGEKILNPESDKTYKEIFANSWTYNTSPRYAVDYYNPSDLRFFLKDSIVNDITLSVGDTVQILDEISETTYSENATIDAIFNDYVVLSNVGFTTEHLNKNLSIRRNLKTAKSSATPIKYGNDVLVSDVQNLYNENNEYFYVASNSLPSYEIQESVKKSSISTANSTTLQGYNSSTDRYSIISFDSSVEFLTGDRIYYKPSNVSLIGLEEGDYYVKVLSPNNKIKLYKSRSLILNDNYVEFTFNSQVVGSHNFILYSQKDELISPQKILKKIPNKKNIKIGTKENTTPGSTGIFANGVELINYKSRDKVYYGPIKDITVFNSGSGYDVVNPPDISITSPSVGTTALSYSNLSGTLKEVIVDPQDFDVNEVISASLTGGNGNGAVLKPVVEKRYREVDFDSRLNYLGGGLDVESETLTFSSNHNFYNGQPIVYNRNGNTAIGVGTYGALTSNELSTGTLSNGSIYYAEVVNDQTIKLYYSLSDYNSGINTVGFTTAGPNGAVASGIHKFRTYEGKNTLRSIVVLNPGSNYQNRKIIVKPESISTANDTITFKNHGFSDGDIINYSTTGSVVSGLSTDFSYYVIKTDDDTFRVASAGVGATISSNYITKNYVNLSSIGSGYHTFNYPKIEVNLNVVYDENVGVRTITATPVITGEITDIHLYEEGSGYGTEIINFHKKPDIIISSGNGAEISPIISNGRILDINLLVGGSGYSSAPELIVNGSGVGAKLRAVVSGGSITDVIVINPGANYDSNTTISVVARGSGCYAEANVRDLTIDYHSRFGEEIIIENKNNNQGLEYGILSYGSNIRDKFSDNGSNHSPIIGWAYDGNPIYGAYGYSNPLSNSSSLKVMESGYTTASVTDRPSSIVSGLFVEDYEFVGGKDLDEYNGRYCVTPEFPNGVYAYFASLNTTTLSPSFPYFIGNSFKSLPVKQTINQDFDFNNSNLIRNTFPYKVSENNSSNDFIGTPDNLIKLKSNVDSIIEGDVNDLEVTASGDNYAVGDKVVFDNSNTSGGGLSVQVKTLSGKTITSVVTTADTYQSAKVIWEDKNTVSLYIDEVNQVNDQDSIVVSNTSSFVNGLSDSHIANVSNESVYLIKEVPSNAVSGVVTDIYISRIPSTLSVGSSLSIGDEVLSVINIFPDNSVVRTLRGISATAHSQSDEVSILTGKIILNLSTPYFESKLNDKLYFNPLQSVGFGTQTGISSSLNYEIGDITKVISIPTQSIYAPNHNFKTSQSVVFTSSGNPIKVSTTGTGGVFDLPQTLYVINKSKDYIGLTTTVGLTTSTDGLYFRSFTANGDDTDYQYSLESNFTQVTAKVEEIKSEVTTLTNHLLQDGDKVNLTVIPNQTTGIGTYSEVTVKYNSQYNKLLINPISFESGAVDDTNNTISLPSHGLITGDKIFYDSSSTLISGLETGSYYINRIDDDTVNICQTYYDALSSPPSVIDFTSTGGTGQSLSQINPLFNIIRNNNLLVNLEDSSLSGYDFKIYTDENFYNEFVSVGSSTSFNVIKSGTPGSSGASLTLNYGSDLPNILYYNLENSGNSIINDKDVNGASKILFNDSEYNGEYVISDTGNTTFKISLKSYPESLSYNQSNTNTLKYSTSSTNARGGVDSIKINSKGFNYDTLPEFASITSSSGLGAEIKPKSDNIGKLNQLTIENSGYNFSADKTLNPEAFISPTIELSNNNTISQIEITFGGYYYQSPPDLVVVNPSTGDVYNTGILEARIQGSSISEIEILNVPKGLSDEVSKIYAINNDNGVGIEECTDSTPGNLTLILSTPILGFATDPFKIGDKVFLENLLVDESISGDGFNSSDHKYNLFPVLSYTNSNPAELILDISDYTTNPGTALVAQNSYATVVNSSNYPVFTVKQTSVDFIIDESLLVSDGGNYVETDLIVSENTKDSVKIYGNYLLKKGDVILGKNSGSLATIENITYNNGIFEIDYSSKKNLGWSNDTGKLNTDYQVTSDNDYYQNLSYSIKSEKEYEDIVNPVNRLLHTSGLKNFADTQIISTPLVGLSTSNVASDSSSGSILDIFSARNVETINNFDFALDVDSFEGKTRLIQFQNRTLSSYTDCISNRVLPIDNINEEFSNSDGNTLLYKDIISYNILGGYNKFLVQIKSIVGTELQSSEVISLPSKSSDSGIIFAERGSLYNTSTEVGELVGLYNEITGKAVLRFIPSNPFDTNYDIKVLRNNYLITEAGIGTQSVGFINLIGSNAIVSSGSSETLFSGDTSTVLSLLVNAEIKNQSTEEVNYLEVYLNHNGTDTYISEYYFDNEFDTYLNSNLIGYFSANIDSGVLTLTYNNEDNNSVLVRTKIIEFGPTSLGIGTYIFKSDGQPDSSVKTARLESNYQSFTGISTVLSVLKDDVSTIKSYIRVGYGQTTALHQLLVINSNNDTQITQYPFLSESVSTGIGTFGSEIDGSNLVVKFYPDAGVTGIVTTQSYSELVQIETDSTNTPNDLTYGTILESFTLSNYFGRNNSDLELFDLSTNGIPIFQKTFNPATTLNIGTGLFTVANHFFSTGERLEYVSASSFDGEPFSDIQVYGAGNLPNEVYAIRVNDAQFKLASSEADSNAGIALTYSSVGDGNAHTLEMYKRMEKTIITVDDVIQSPIAFTNSSSVLVDNGGSIGSASSFFALTGISSIFTGDLLKIDDEYAQVISVGIATTSVGPITESGNFNVVEVSRGAAGSSAASHTDGTVAYIYSGSFNIVNNKIFFLEAPRGSVDDGFNESNLPTPKSSFGGRVFLRNDYTTNKIYDDISKQFTGIGATYTVTVGGANTTGIETGSGILLVNDIFQTPTTENNSGNNYKFIESVGVTSVQYSGITTLVGGDLFISDYDVNQNQLPRGGIIVSLGSTPGLGYAPLVGASVTAVINSGVIQNSIGIGTTDNTGSGYNNIISIGVTAYDPQGTGSGAIITATPGVGGSLSFNVSNGGSGYSNETQIQVSTPSYENLEVIGVSRRDIGPTTETGTGLLVSLEVGASTRTGIGSTLFEVTNFKISRPGYGFRPGDVITPVGLVTDGYLPSVVEQFQLRVIDTFNDSFSAWQFGELDYIDSVKNLQNGSTTRFPLYYNTQLLSFETSNPNIDLSQLLLIFVNGVLQEPGKAYTFDGGTSIRFTEAPEEDDNVAIFFYRGTRGEDSDLVEINASIEVGDILKINKDNTNSLTVSQEERSIFDITASNEVKTNIYTGDGIDEVNYKPTDWSKQKNDIFVEGQFIYKTRDSIESQIYPTARIIGDVSDTDTGIFVDDAQFFNYEENESSVVIDNVDGLIVIESNPVAAEITANVSIAGTISSLTIVDGGSGYTGSSVSLSIAAPSTIGVGIGTTATATASITAGSITSVTITNPGLGYTQSNSPQVLAPTENVIYENVTNISNVTGSSGIVTGISPVAGVGVPSGLQFFLNSDTTSAYTNLIVGYPIYISQTRVGSGITSIDDSDSAVIGIGTSYVDNVYIIKSKTDLGDGNANIVVNIDSGSNTSGVTTSGTVTSPVGRFSWGRLFGLTRSSSPISIGVTGLTIDSGLSTFPTIQRRGFGLRSNGSLRKRLS